MFAFAFTDDSRPCKRLSTALQHKFGANCLNGRNLNVRTVEVQPGSVADTKLPGIKTDNCF